jgi:hypothetical protein
MAKNNPNPEVNKEEGKQGSEQTFNTADQLGRWMVRWA